ncbi:MAG TPA: antitoxin VapB family protein [archaeon]|nr:antitoxin VapB family protein [archaeon]
MASKNISLKPEAYERLLALKEAEESFSDEVLRLTYRKTMKGLKECFGLWKDISEKDIKAMEAAINTSKNSKTSDIAKKWES